MSLEEFYNQIVESFPLECESNENVRDLLIRKFCELLSSVEQIEKNERWVVGSRYATVMSLSNVCKLMIKCFDEIHAGYHHKAIETLDECFKKKLFCFKTIKCGREFYRMRRNEDSRQFSLEDMFHIPFCKRHIIGTQRYSAPGIPCLYLSNRICGCWEELNRPQLSDCMVSRFVLTQDIKVFDINLMPYEQLKEEKITWLHLIPFIMSCMIKVKDETYKFKDEYIFPQLIMEWLLSSETAKKEKIRGIQYTSVKKNRAFGYKDKDYMCLALPAVSFESNAPLNELFSLTEPTSDEIERIINHNKEIKPAKQKRFTSFDQLENALKDSKRFPLKQIKTEAMNKNLKLDEFIDIFKNYSKEYKHVVALEKQTEDEQLKGVYCSVLKGIKGKVLQIYRKCPELQLEEHSFHFLSSKNFDKDILKLESDIKEIKENQNSIN